MHNTIDNRCSSGVIKRGLASEVSSEHCRSRNGGRCWCRRPRIDRLVIIEEEEELSLQDGSSNRKPKIVVTKTRDHLGLGWLCEGIVCRIERVILKEFDASPWNLSVPPLVI